MPHLGTEGASAKTQTTTMASAQRVEELQAKGIDTDSAAAKEDVVRKQGWPHQLPLMTSAKV